MIFASVTSACQPTPSLSRVCFPVAQIKQSWRLQLPGPIGGVLCWKIFSLSHSLKGGGDQVGAWHWARTFADGPEGQCGWRQLENMVGTIYAIYIFDLCKAAALLLQMSSSCFGACERSSCYSGCWHRITFRLPPASGAEPHTLPFSFRGAASVKFLTGLWSRIGCRPCKFYQQLLASLAFVHFNNLLVHLLASATILIYWCGEMVWNRCVMVTHFNSGCLY